MMNDQNKESPDSHMTVMLRSHDGYYLYIPLVRDRWEWLGHSHHKIYKLVEWLVTRHSENFLST